MNTQCANCHCAKNRIRGVGLNDSLCYSCEDTWLEQEGIWIDPAGGAHSNNEEDPAWMYR